MLCFVIVATTGTKAQFQLCCFISGNHAPLASADFNTNAHTHVSVTPADCPPHTPRIVSLSSVLLPCSDSHNVSGISCFTTQRSCISQFGGMPVPRGNFVSHGLG